SITYVTSDSGGLAHSVSRRALDSGTSRELFRLGGPTGVISLPLVSPDGKWVAFVTSDGTVAGLEGAELRVMPADGGPTRTIRRGRTAWARGMSWTPDGREILFVLPKDKEFQLWAVNVA